MAKFAIVAPPQILNHIDAAGCLGDDHLLLAHDIVKRPHKYRQLFDLWMGDDRNVILDNSVIELGHAVDLSMIKDAHDVVNPTFTVLPDVMLSSLGTMKESLNAYEMWGPEIVERRRGRFMVVPQGLTLQEFAKCAEAFAYETHITCWGVPRNLVKTLGTRRDAIPILKAINPYRRIHLLGFSDYMIDDVICGRNPDVYSIDSAVPLRLGTQLSLATVPPPRGDWWETAEPTRHTLKNLEIARRWFQS
jgi:hypothetical protein